MVTYKLLDTDFDQACNGLEIYHNVALEEGNILVVASSAELAKQLGTVVKDKVLQLGKDLIKEVLTGK